MSPARPYDRTERLSDALVHLAGLVLALGAVPVLITLAALWHADVVSVLGVSVYGGTLIAMLTASLACNHVTAEEWSGLLRRLDHSAIFLKIAGTVTPFVLLSRTGTTFLIGMWVAAIAASLIAMVSRRRTNGLSVVIGLAMGWAVLVAGGEVIAATSTPVFFLMIAGGIAYSLGTPFLLWKGLRFHNTIWHGFVVVASIVFFVAITWHLAATSPVKV
ncbi:hemolysin III family protein [Paracoccus sp. TK19116]|uniref:Hemolysin III family protein n=1 Tax=Paracoccus albicereus TaxID=2922394 RepID=A0ABT1MUK6_9RHOB|nr:hemolysin III family protein [Paracoccus albicereus]MCQ0972015.1 hemolysin III family protein [Paracoccus albicereus]